MSTAKYSGNMLPNIARIVDACFNGMCAVEHCTHLAKAECTGCGTRLCHGHAVEIAERDGVADFACAECAELVRQKNALPALDRRCQQVILFRPDDGDQCRRSAALYDLATDSFICQGCRDKGAV